MEGPLVGLGSSGVQELAMQELNAASGFSWKDFLRPGCLIGLIGLLIIAISIVRYAWGNHNVDLLANPEAVAAGGSVKIMVWLVVGIGVSIFGALLAYVDYSRR